MKKRLMIYSALLTSCIISLASCNEINSSSTPVDSSSVDDTSSTPVEVKVNGISITSENNVRTIKVGETLQLSATVYPLEVLQDVNWSSLDSSVATVDEFGLVSALSVGEVNIKATYVLDETISQTFALIIEEKEPEVILPESVSISAPNNETSLMVGATLQLQAAVLPENANQNVSWTSSDTSIATVSRGLVSALKEGSVTITATSREVETVTATYELTIEKFDGDNPTLNEAFVNMEFTSHDKYLTCDNDTMLKIKGIVTHVTPVDENCVNYYIQNGDKGYYVYQQDITLFPVEVGKSYEVGGYKKYYRGLREIVNVEYFKESSETFNYTISDISSYDVSNTETMLPFHASYISGEATLLEKVANTTKAFSADVSINGHETVLRVDPTYMSEQEFLAIANGFDSIVNGCKIRFSGIMSAYGYSTPSNQILILKSNDLVFDNVSDDLLLSSKVSEFSIVNSVETDVNTISLPSSLQDLEGSKITWTSNSNIIDTTSGNINRPLNDSVVTLTALFKYNEASLEKTFEINVFGSNSDNYEVLVTLDLEDALPSQNYGNSASKSGYAEGNVTLGGYTWMLRNALISSISNDRYNGIFAIRAKSATDDASTGRIEILSEGEFNIIEFQAAIYGNDINAKVGVCYTTDNGTTWVDSGTIFDITTTTLQTYRVTLPEGNKRIAIYIVAGSGNRVNFDDIKLMR